MIRTSHLSLLALPLLIAAPAGALTINFDYSHDTSGFFSDPARKAVLNLAAATYAGFTDSLSAITPSGSNHWTASFLEPTNTSATATAADLAVSANAVTVFVGASALGGTTLGLGGPGGYSYSGVTQSFANAVNNRGQAGDTGNSATATDFARWGGAISFDSATNWHFGLTATGLTGSKADFLSVAIHELGHVLGFGTSDSFKHYTSGTNFIGPASKAKYANSPVPLRPPVPANNDPGFDHWANGTAGKVNGVRTQETAMDPSLTMGTRKLFTDLDFAGMTDIGWQVRVPGDANGNGAIDRDDFALIDRGYAKQLTGWSNGDFNADGTIDARDYQIIDLYYVAQTGAFAPDLLAEREAQFGPAYAADLAAFVPEPSSAACVLVAAALTTVRRPRRV